MEATSPVLPHAEFPEVVYAAGQSEYLRLPAVNITYSDGTKSVITSYKLSWRERITVLLYGRIWLEQLTFGQKLQPQRPTVIEPLTER
jgi:hypothetical protein